MADKKKITELISEGQFEKAYKEIKILLKSNSDDINLQHDYGFVTTHLQKFDESFKAYNKVIELAPGSSLGYTGIGFIHRIQEHNEEALKAFKKGIEKATDNAMVYFEIGEIYFEMDEYENAKNAYLKAIQFGGAETEGETLHRIAQVELGLENYDKAIDIANNVLKKDPSYLSIYNILGIANYLKKNWKESSKYFKKFLDKFPGDEAAKNLLNEVEENL